MAEFTLTDEQTSIIKAPREASMLIVAGAGSGKTFTMTERIISLIRSGVPAHNILGLTFTKAAASELLTRVAAAVSKHRLKISDSELSSNSSDDGIDDVFMKPEVYTYDAFFQSIVRQYGLLVGMDPNTVPLSQAGAYQLADEVVHESLRGALGDMVAGYDEETRAADIDDIGTYSSFVRSVVALSDAISACMIDQTCTTIDEAIERIEHWDSAFIEHINHIIEREYPQEKNLPDFGHDVALTGAKTRSGVEKWKKKSGREYLAGILTQIREKTRLRSVYLTYVKLFAQRKRELKMAQFADFTIAAMQLVQRFPWIGEQYRSQFAYVFLDEYQDSSTAQASLIIQLFAPHGVNAPSDSSSQRSSKLTAVGDPYQAIYAWRGAAPGAFHSFLKDTGIEAPLKLSKTVRNPHLVLDMANKFTEPLRAGLRDAYGRRGSIQREEVPVSELSALDGAQTGSIAAVAYRTRKQEIDGVVRYAQAAIAKSKKTNDELIKRGEPAKPGPFVAVLLRSKTHMNEFADALTQAGLTVQVDGVHSVMDRPDAHDLVNLLHMVADHSNTAAVMNLFAGSRFDMSAHDLQCFADAVSRYNAHVQRTLLDHAGLERPRRGEWIMPAVVSLTDVLSSGDKERAGILDHYYQGSKQGRACIDNFASAFVRVESAAQTGLENVIRAGADALGLDIDVAVAYAISRAQNLTGQALPVSSTDAIVDLAQTYENELTDGIRPSLSGFLSWVESDDNASAPDPTILGSAQADVTVCTIHHSKGLEWDSVIIPEMNKGTFPSNQGSSLKLHAPESDVPIPFGQYVAEANTWVTNPVDVPYPVRADKEAVAQFPDFNEFDNSLPTAEILEERVDGYLRIPGDNLPDELNLREEIGQVIVQEERRLVYVAVTRAKRDVLMASSQKPTEVTDNYEPVGYSPAISPADQVTEDMPSDNAKSVRPSFSDTSIFLAEAYEYLCSSQIARTYGEENVINLHAAYEDCGFEDAPQGVFVGQDAFEYAAETVGGALEAARHATLVMDKAKYSHPRRIDPRVGETLNATAQLCDTESSESGQEGQLRKAAQRIHEAMQTLGFAHAQQSEENADKKIIESAQNVRRQRNTSVTAIQREIADMAKDNTEKTDVIRARAIMRPVPNIIHYDAGGELGAANMGTVFHAFAQRYFTVDNPSSSGALADADFVEAKEAIRAEVLSEKPHSTYEKRMHEWKLRLLNSRFDPRDSDGVEVPFAYMPQGAKRAVTGLIDAVFVGEQLPGSPISAAAHSVGHEIKYTVIDWKTGHKPSTEEDIANKLLQVDMYRKILAALRGVDVSEVDAALYYVSEEDESSRIIPATVKSSPEIEELLCDVRDDFLRESRED